MSSKIKKTPKDNYQKLVKAVYAFEKARGWNPVSADLAKSVVIEAAELLEKFQWTESDLLAHGSYSHPINKVELGEEIADVFWYLLVLCKKEDIDLLAALRDKYHKNDLKYPAVKFKGKHNPQFYLAQKRKYREGRQKSRI